VRKLVNKEKPTKKKKNEEKRRNCINTSGREGGPRVTDRQRKGGDKAEILGDFHANEQKKNF